MQFRSIKDALAHDKPSQVTTLDLSNQNLGEVPSEIGKLTNLRVLNLEHNNLTVLPEEIGFLKNLTTLVLNSNLLKTLPLSMKNLSNLMKLEVNRNDLDELPDFFEDMTNLRGIYAKKNRLNSLPNSLKSSNIQVLDVRQNGFNAIPPLIFHIPKLTNIQGIMGDGHTSPKEIMSSFNNAFNKTGLDTDRYRESFVLLTEDNVAFPLSTLLTLTQINFQTVRSKAIDLALKHSLNQPLSSKMMVSVLGNTSISKLEIKEKLKGLDISYESKITDKTTHIVLGNLPKLAGEIDDDKQYTIWLEKDLNNYFETIDKPYLLETDSDTSEQKEQLSRLLLSADDANIGLAVQILKGGGVPENLIEEVFLAYKLCNDSKIKLEIKKLLQINASTSVIDALSKRDLLFDPKKTNPSYRSEDTEKDLFKALKKYSAYTNDLDWNKIAFLLQEHFGYGARYVFSYSNEGSELRKAIIEKNIEGNKLDFNKVYSKGQPDLTFAYTYPYYIPRPTPLEIFDLEQLTELNLSGCYIGNLPEQIGKLKNLKHLSLSNNFIQKLPQNISLLTNLEHLDISQNEFKTFPIEIYSLKKLQTCKIGRNRKKWENNLIIVPPDIQTHLPNCKIINQYE